MRAIVGIGSNLGDRVANVQAAIEKLRLLPGVREAIASPLDETAPVGPAQPEYVNAAVLLAVEPARSARSLMSALLAVEAEMGRVRGERFGPRTIDLDVLWMASDDDDRCLPSTHEVALVPHPRLSERAFALVPLLDVVPLARDPLGNAYAEMAATLDHSGVRLLMTP